MIVKDFTSMNNEDEYRGGAGRLKLLRLPANIWQQKFWIIQKVIFCWTSQNITYKVLDYHCVCQLTI